MSLARQVVPPTSLRRLQTVLLRLLCRHTVRRGRFVLEFHGIAPRRISAVPAPYHPRLLADDLAQILSWLSGYFQFLDLPSFLAGKGPGVLLTFDDGYANTGRVALPVLERFAAPALVFVTTGAVRSGAFPRSFWEEWRGSAGTAIPDADPEAKATLLAPLTPEELERLSGHPLITIGSHTESHPRLTTLSDEDLERELVESMFYLQRRTGREVEVLAYPYGDADERVAACAREVGYRWAFVEEPRSIQDPALNLARIGIYRSSFLYVLAKMVGLQRPPYAPLQIG